MESEWHTEVVNREHDQGSKSEEHQRYQKKSSGGLRTAQEMYWICGTPQKGWGSSGDNSRRAIIFLAMTEVVLCQNASLILNSYQVGRREAACPPLWDHLPQITMLPQCCQWVTNGLFFSSQERISGQRNNIMLLQEQAPRCGPPAPAGVFPCQSPEPMERDKDAKKLSHRVAEAPEYWSISPGLSACIYLECSKSLPTIMLFNNKAI